MRDPMMMMMTLMILEKRSFSLTVKFDKAFSKSVIKPMIASVDTGSSAYGGGQAKSTSRDNSIWFSH